MSESIDQLAHLIERDHEPDAAHLSRRVWMQNLALITASGGIAWACGKDEAKSEDQLGDKTALDLPGDGLRLNNALALEHEAISLYRHAIDLTFMKASTNAALHAIASAFLAHHESHRSTLQTALNDLRSRDPAVAGAVSSKADAEYLAPHVGLLLDIKSVIRLITLKEAVAAQAYFGLVAGFTDRTLAQTSGLLGGDEAAHFGVLRAVLLLVAADTAITTTGGLSSVIPGALPSSWRDLPGPGA